MIYLNDGFSSDVIHDYGEAFLGFSREVFLEKKVVDKIHLLDVIRWLFYLLE